MKGNLGPDPFAHLMPSERNSPPDWTESRYKTVFDEDGKEVELHFVGFGAEGEWMTRDEERAHTAEIYQRCNDRREAEKAADLRAEENGHWGNDYSDGIVISSGGSESAPVKVRREKSDRGDRAMSIGGWVFFLLIFAGCLAGIMSSL